jgi:hypothetical protein
MPSNKTKSVAGRPAHPEAEGPVGTNWKSLGDITTHIAEVLRQSICRGGLFNFRLKPRRTNGDGATLH